MPRRCLNATLRTIQNKKKIHHKALRTRRKPDKPISVPLYDNSMLGIEFIRSRTPEYTAQRWIITSSHPHPSIPNFSLPALAGNPDSALGWITGQSAQEWRPEQCPEELGPQRWSSIHGRAKCLKGWLFIYLLMLRLKKAKAAG